MEDTGQDTTIRIGVDGTGVSAGVTSIKRSLADLGTSVKSITDKTNAEISKIGSGDLKLDAGVAKATKAVIKQTGELEKQIAAFGSTAFTGFSNISKSAEAAYVSMAGKAIPTTYIDNYLTRLKEAQLLDAKRASDAKAVAEAIAASTAKTIAIEEHYADLKRQHAAYNKSLADQEIASTKARAAALAAYATEAQNAELNLIHTGRGKSSAMLIDKGQRLGFTEAEINTYTAGLKKVEAANAAAFAVANPHIGKLKAEAEAAGTTVKGLSASLRNVPAQFTDIVVSLQGGQAPLTVLLQQGGQLKDMFGGAGNAFRALGGYVMGLINPFTMAAGAVAGIGVAMASINGKDKALLALSTQLEGTGRASVSATGDIKGLIKELNNVPGISKSAATAILGEFAKVQGLGGNMFRGLGASVADFAAATGTDLPSAARKLASAFADPAKGARELDESLGTLTASQIIVIEKMADMGNKAGAQAALLDALKEATQGLADQAMTPLGKATEDLSNAWDEMLTNVGNADALRSANSSLAEMIGMVARLTTGLANMKLPAWMGTGFDFTRASFNAFFDYSKPKVAPEGSWGDGGASGSWAPTQTETDRQVKAALDATKGYTSQSESVAKLKAVASQAKAALGELEAQSKGNSAEAALLRERISGVNEKLADMAKKAKGPAYQVPEYDKLISDMDKANSMAQQEIATGEALSKSEKYRITTLYALVDAYNAKKISAKQLADAEVYLDKVTGEMASAEQQIATANAQAEAIKAIEKARTDAIKSHAKELESLGEKAQKLEDEVAMYGMSKEAIEELTTARMLDQIEVLRGFDNSAEEIARIEHVIEARKRLAAAGTAKDIKDGNKKVAKDAAAEWDKYADQIGQSLTDQLMEGGKSGAEYIENLFRTMILRPVIQALVTPIAQSVSSSIMSGGSGGGASGFNIFNNTSGLGDGLSVTLGKTASTLINNGYQQSGEALAGMAKAANTYSSQITMAGNALSYFSAAQSLADGKYGAAAGQAIGAYFGGPIGGSIGNAIGSAIDEAFGGGGGPKSESTYGSAYGQLGDTSKKGLAGTYATGVEDAWKTLAKELEITTALKVGAQTSIDTQGDAQTIFDAYGTVNGQVVSSRAGRLGSAENVGRDEAALQAAMAEETTRLLFAALKASDLPEQYKTYLSTIGDSVADMTQAMTIVAVVDSFNDALQNLPFENLKTLSFEAAKGLIEVAGGMDVLGANLGTYYTNFYSAEEQRLQTIKTINAATAGSGLDAATATRESFRQIVEAQDLTTDSGRATYAALLSVSGAFAGLTPVIADAAAKLAEVNQGWQDQLDVLTGTTTERDIALRDATDESTRAIMRQVYAQEDLVTAADKATADAATATSVAMSAIQRAVDAQRKIYQVQVDASQEAVTEIKSIFDTLGSGIKTLYGQVDSTQQAAQGRAFIDNALSNAQMSGYLPDSKDLADAVQAAMNDSTVYASQAESDFAKLALAGSMSALKDISGTQLSAAEKALQYAQDQLKALDGVLDSAQKQIDAINGVDTSVKSVAEALGELARALTSVNAAAGKGGLQGIVSTGASYAGNSAIPTRIPTVGDGGIDKYALIGYAGGAIGQTQKAYTSDWIAQELQTAVEQGYSASEIAKGGQLNYGIPDVQILAAGKRLGLPGFAVGTNYVPSDMIAQIHEGEAIVPKAYNPAVGGQSNGKLEALVEGLTKEVQRLQSIVNDGNNNTRRTADAVNGRPEMPMLVETV